MAITLVAAPCLLLPVFFDWAEFTPENVAKDMPRLLAEAEKNVAAIEASAPKTYEDFVWKLNDASRDLMQCWSRVAHIQMVMNSDAWRKVEEDFQPQVVMFSLRVGQSKKLYEISKAVLKNLTGEGTELATRRRILEKMIQSAELSGVGLEGEKLARFNEIQQRLAKLSTDFANAVIDATKAFKFEKDGKTYTIDDANYQQLIKHCADREVREKLMRARASRAPENAARIDEMLKLRQEEAKILGFPDYVALSLATKSAPSRDAVLGMINELDEATKAAAARENKELGEGLAPWDYEYLAERLREKKYAYSEEELKRYFELEDVLKGLFRIANLLFEVEVAELKGADRPSVWHPDVRVFAVKEAGKVISHFYFDPYVRSGQKSGGAWMNELKNRSKVKVGGEERLTLPLTTIVTNFPQPDGNGKCHLTFRDVETIFHEFGHALQQMLTRMDEESVAGINLIEWDAVEVASQFMQNWCLDDRTGIKVPAELKAKVRAAKNFRAAYACRRQLSFAKTDLLIHTADVISARRTPNQVKTEVFAHFGLPMVEEDIFLCALTHVFAGGYAAGYYGYKWAEVMSADCFGAFEEAGLADTAAMKKVGKRYRETVLGLGGSISAIDVFRRFRGRDPGIDAILRQQGLKEQSR